MLVFVMGFIYIFVFSFIVFCSLVFVMVYFIEEEVGIEGGYFFR